MYAVRDCCRVLQVSLAGYYRWRQRGARAELAVKIRGVHVANHQVYGSPRVYAEQGRG